MESIAFKDCILFDHQTGLNEKLWAAKTCFIKHLRFLSAATRALYKCVFIQFALSSSLIRRRLNGSSAQKSLLAKKRHPKRDRHPPEEAPLPANVIRTCTGLIIWASWLRRWKSVCQILVEPFYPSIRRSQWTLFEWNLAHNWQSCYAPSALKRTWKKFIYSARSALNGVLWFRFGHMKILFWIWDQNRIPGIPFDSRGAVKAAFLQAFCGTEFMRSP